MALVVGIRVLLPVVVRRELVGQASEALHAAVEIGDVDLALWKGGIALEEVAIRPAGEPPDAPSEPLLAWKRLAIELRWLPLLWRTIELRSLVLEGPRVALDRLEGGALNLMQLGRAPVAAPADTPATPPTTTTTTLPSGTTATPGWGFGVDRVTLRDGWVRFRDLQLKAVEPVEVTIDTVDVRRVAFAPGVYGEPTRIDLAAKVDRGTLRLTADLTPTPDGVQVDADVKAKRLPLRRLRIYIPRVGWSDLHGELAAALDAHFTTGRRTEVSGTVVLGDIAVRVPGLDEPALAWRRLRVRAHPVDVRAQRVALALVDLEGATLVVQPQGGDLLPFLAMAAGEAVPPPQSGEPAAAGPPWRWSVGTVDLRDTSVRLLGPEGPLLVGVTLAARDLADDRSEPSPVTAGIKVGDGTVAVDGGVRVAPPGVEGTITIDRLSLPELVAAAGALPPGLLQVGRLGGTLQVAAGAPAPPREVRVQGTLTLAEPWLAAADQYEFSTGAFAVTAAIDEVYVPTPPAPLQVRLARLELDKPYLQLSRTAAGITLPAFQPPPAAGAPPPPREPVAPSPQVAPPAPPQIDVGKLAITGGRVYVTDRTVTPFYTGALDPIDATAERVHWPDLAVGKVRLAATLDAKGKIEVDGTIAPAGSTLKVNTRDVLLPSFNPQMLALSSYSIPKGRLEVATTAEFGPRGYRSTSQVTLRDFDLASRAGDSLFQEQFGIPLRMALALLRDVHGDIGLDIPVEADEQGTRVGVLSIVGQALRRALVNALASPLKLAGMVFGGEGEQAGAPAPIAFRPGRAALTPEGATQAEQLAHLLASRPGLGATLTAAVTPTDVRWLREQALSEELAGSQGMFGALKNLPARGVRERVRTALEARRRDEPGSLSADDAAEMERWLAERPAPPAERVQALAAERLDGLVTLLRQRYGLGPERVAVTPPGSGPGEEPPAVRFALGALGER